MSQENIWPTQVLTLSTKSRTFCIVQVSSKKSTIRRRRMVPLDTVAASGLLGRGARRLLGPEVVVIRHRPRNVGVQVPFHRALGERPLGIHDLLEERVLA